MFPVEIRAPKSMQSNSTREFWCLHFILPFSDTASSAGQYNEYMQFTMMSKMTMLWWSCRYSQGDHTPSGCVLLHAQFHLTFLNTALNLHPNLSKRISQAYRLFAWWSDDTEKKKCKETISSYRVNSLTFWIYRHVFRWAPSSTYQIQLSELPPQHAIECRSYSI